MKLKADHVGVGLAIVGLFLNANMIIWCWPCYMMSNVFMAIHFIPKREYPYLFLLVVYSILNTYGWYQWATE